MNNEVLCMQPKYKRILLKLSGESLAGEERHGIDFDTVLKICEPIKKCVDAGVQVGVVVGGGNFWRGRSSGEMDRTRADHMGMLATTINALGVCDALIFATALESGDRLLSGNVKHFKEVPLLDASAFRVAPATGEKASGGGHAK